LQKVETAVFMVLQNFLSTWRYAVGKRFLEGLPIHKNATKNARPIRLAWSLQIIRLRASCPIRKACGQKGQLLFLYDWRVLEGHVYYCLLLTSLSIQTAWLETPGGSQYGCLWA